MRNIICLHVHSTIGSEDSEIRPEVLMKQTAEVGLTGVAITEHVAPWSDEDTLRYCRECGHAGVTAWTGTGKTQVAR